jgi:hypothetical protein
MERVVWVAVVDRFEIFGELLDTGEKVYSAAVISSHSCVNDSMLRYAREKLTAIPL